MSRQSTNIQYTYEGKCFDSEMRNNPTLYIMNGWNPHVILKVEG